MNIWTFLKKILRICKTCLLLQGNHSDNLELSYYAISSYLDNQNSRKPVLRTFLRKMTPSLREITRFEGRNIFQPLSPVRNHACLSSYAKLAKTNQAIPRKWPKTYFVAKIWPILAHIWPKYFFQPLRPPSPVRHHACLPSYAKLAKTNDAISRK
jgi:hypothetical protein